MEKKHIITLGGLPGSGKSTVRDLLTEKLNYTAFSTGDYMRSLAIEYGVSFDEFNAMIAKDKSIDERIDAEQKRIGTEEEKYVIDAHIGFHFIPDSFKVFLTVPPSISAKRILGDSEQETRKSVGDVMSSLEEAKQRIQARLHNHKDRYQRFYNVNPYDVTQFDFIIDTNGITPDQVVERIVAAYEEWLNEA